MRKLVLLTIMAVACQGWASAPAVVNCEKWMTEADEASKLTALQEYSPDGQRQLNGTVLTLKGKSYDLAKIDPDLEGIGFPGSHYFTRDNYLVYETRSDNNRYYVKVVNLSTLQIENTIKLSEDESLARAYAKDIFILRLSDTVFSPIDGSVTKSAGLGIARISKFLGMNRKSVTPIPRTNVASGFEVASMLSPNGRYIAFATYYEYYQGFSSRRIERRYGDAMEVTIFDLITDSVVYNSNFMKVNNAERPMVVSGIDRVIWNSFNELIVSGYERSTQHIVINPITGAERLLGILHGIEPRMMSVDTDGNQVVIFNFTTSSGVAKGLRLTGLSDYGHNWSLQEQFGYSFVGDSFLILSQYGKAVLVIDIHTEQPVTLGQVAGGGHLEDLFLYNRL